MTPLPLENAKQVIDALGGRALVVTLTDAKNTNVVGNWERDGEFPARLFLLMSAALKERGYKAPAKLWGQVEPEAAERAA